MTQPRLSYIICATPRSGSNLLSEALALTGVAGVPQEYFLPWINDPARIGPTFLDDVLAAGTGSNGVFGVKIMWGHLDTCVRHMRTLLACDDLPPHEILTRVFPNLHYVHMTREDRTRQAISLAKASQSGRWVAFKADANAGENARQHMQRFEAFFGPVVAAETAVANDGRLEYDFQALLSIQQMLAEHDRAWEGFFAAAGIRPHRVVYEQLVADYEHTTRRVLEALGLAGSVEDAVRRRVMACQSDAVNDDWARRFADDLRALQERHAT